MGRFKRGRVTSRASQPSGARVKLRSAMPAFATVTRRGKESKYGPVKGKRPAGIKTTIKGIGKG